jgi:GTP pyrophosphokinase
VTGRRKTAYSISQKMQVKNVTMDQLSDVMAFRIIVDSNANCYQTLGVIHTAFPVVMGRFKDYISTPKTNGYQSLHTGVIGPMRQKIEIQIRTGEMDDTAERGVAAHWDYKESLDQENTQVERQARLETFRWARELVSLLELNEEATEFLENTKLEMYQDKVFCFTPKGDLISLPKGATAIDFAYAVHTDVGDRCVGVLVNDKRRQLTTELVNGDQVSIITEKNASPRSDWEDFAKTGRARSAIKRFIRLQKQDEFARVGKVLLEREYRFRKKRFREQHIDKFLSAFSVNSRDELYAQIAEDLMKSGEVFDRLHPDLARSSIGDKSSQTVDTSPEPLFHVDKAHAGLAVHLGKCCHPLPGDKIVGIVTTGKGITVHTKNCNTLAKFVEIPELWLNVDWPRSATRRFAGRIHAVVVNEPGALAALCSVIGQQAGNITHIQLTERDMNFFTFILDIDVKNLEHIHSIIAVLRSNKYIESVERRGL